jgi:hypothetical protein
MSQNQRCSNRPRPWNRKKYNGVEDENDDEDEPKDALNQHPANLIYETTVSFSIKFTASTASVTRNSQPVTLTPSLSNPKSQITNPKSKDPQLATRNAQPVTRTP